jgi:hypothetical protein
MAVKAGKAGRWLARAADAYLLHTCKTEFLDSSMMRVYGACWFLLSSWRFSWLVVLVAVLSEGLVASWVRSMRS